MPYLFEFRKDMTKKRIEPIQTENNQRESDQSENSSNTSWIMKEQMTPIINAMGKKEKIKRGRQRHEMPQIDKNIEQP